MSAMALDRLLRSVVINETSGCWEWTKRRGKTGYGYFQWWAHGRKCWSAHRAAWLLTYGSLPPKPLELHHLCANRACVNPSHLLPVTHRENLSLKPPIVACPVGHDYTPENTYVSPRGWRSCRICRSASRRRYLASRVLIAS